MTVEMTEREYRWFLAAKAVLEKDLRAELVPTKDGVRVLRVKREAVKQ